MDNVLEWVLLVGPAVIIAIALWLIIRWGRRTGRIQKVDMQKSHEGRVDKD